MLAEFKNKAVSAAAKQALNNTTLAKRGQSNSNLLLKIAVVGAVGFVAYRAYTKLNGVIADAVEPVANWWVNATNEKIETTQSGFFLKSRDLDSNFKMKDSYKQIYLGMNDGNKAIIARLLDPYDRVKEQYRYLIDKEQPVTLQTLGG